MMSLFHSMRDFIYFTRMYQWHPSKMPLMLGFASIMLLVTPNSSQGILWILTVYVLTSLFLATAYMLNNVADKEKDDIANKKTGLEGWSHKKRFILVIV